MKDYAHSSDPFSLVEKIYIAMARLDPRDVQIDADAKEIVDWTRAAQDPVPSREGQE